MSPRYIRRPPERSDTAAAAVVSVAIGAAVGAVAFYLIRMLAAREELPGHRGGAATADQSRGE